MGLHQIHRCYFIHLAEFVTFFLVESPAIWIVGSGSAQNFKILGFVLQRRYQDTALTCQSGDELGFLGLESP